MSGATQFYRRARESVKRMRVRIALLVLIILLFIVGPTAVRWYTDYLWFVETGHGPVFWVPLLSRIVVATVVGAAVWLLLYTNLRPVVRAMSGDIVEMAMHGGIFRPARGRGSRGIGVWVWIFLVPALLAGYAASSRWVMFQQFVHGVDFGATDPLFGRDVGFFVFRLALYRSTASALFAVLVAITAGVLVGYGVVYGRLTLRRIAATPPRVRAHLSTLIGALVLARGWGFWLDAYALVYSTRGPAFGASYTDVHAVLPALRALAILFGVCGVLLVANARLRTVRLAAFTLVLIAAAWGGGLVVLPGLVQSFRVRPNELTAEAPFIARGIAATRQGFALDRIRERQFPAAPLTAEHVRRNRATIDNVRLWDYRPMLSALSQLQTLRPYYTFSDVDVDRYMIGGTARQVLLSARELAVQRLPVAARTWTNEHLVYTHGYGLVMSPVNRVTEEGMPDFFIRDIPPVSTVGITPTRSQIYFGEQTSTYAIVNTRVPELDYPSGADNAYTRYAGRGGIRLGYLPRLALAYRFGDSRLLLSRDITRASRLLFARNISTRARRLAPFLQYDRDPYLVLADGRLVWIIDAYTTTGRYPYATRYGDLNYIRNSVKVVVDAYHGDVTFYLMTPDDPLARTYASIFPTLFKPVSEMPPAIAAHLRYPVDLFQIQAQVYSTFHMRDPQVFYNREDAWGVAREVFGNETVHVEPYYVTMRLEGDRPEFVLILPFVPAGRDNMISWMAARNDPPGYGQVVVYRFPKAGVVFGPLQIEARIDQEPVIAQQLTLWNQQGSQVIRGNLLVIPLDDSVLYIEPIFLQAERAQFPELKRIVAASGSRLVMAPTLDEAIEGLFAQPRPGPSDGPPAAAADLANQALEIYRRAQERLRAGDLSGYHQELQRLGPVLERLKNALTSR
jgi:uncharacterized membrane protein (UPF0182 family)